MVELYLLTGGVIVGWRELSTRTKVQSDTPTIGVTRDGRITWNRATQEALGAPVRVALLYDPEQRRLALRKVTTNEPGRSFRVFKASRQATWGISARGALKAAGIVHSQAYRQEAKHYGDGIWGIEIGALFEDGK